MTEPGALYLGSPGRMMELPPPDTGVQPAGMRYAALTRSLNGTGTEWFFGTKRKISVKLPYTNPVERSWLQLCWEGAVQPLWFIESLTPNRFPEGVAATGSTLRGEREFTSDGTIATSGLQPDFPGAPPRSVKVTGGTSLTAPGVPCVDGQTLTFSCWVAASSTVYLYVTFTDVTGGTLSTVTGQVTPTDASTLTKVVLAAPQPDRAAFATVELEFANTTVTTAAWMITETGSTDWTPGGGAYRVSFTDKSSDSDLWPLESVSITLEEL